MLIIYQFCRATPEGDPAEWLTTYDPDYDAALNFEAQFSAECSVNECQWIVPGTFV